MCYAYRAEGPDFVPGLPHVLCLSSRGPSFRTRITTCVMRIESRQAFISYHHMLLLLTLAGRNTAVSHRALVRSVAEGGMNIMRVWGGGESLRFLLFCGGHVCPAPAHCCWHQTKCTSCCCRLLRIQPCLICDCARPRDFKVVTRGGRCVPVRGFL